MAFGAPVQLHRLLSLPTSLRAAATHPPASFVVISNETRFCPRAVFHPPLSGCPLRCLGNTTTRCCATSRRCRPSQALSRPSGGNTLCSVSRSWSSGWRLSTGEQAFFSPHGRLRNPPFPLCHWLIVANQVSSAFYCMHQLRKHYFVFFAFILSCSWQTTACVFYLSVGRKTM